MATGNDTEAIVARLDLPDDPPGFGQDPPPRRVASPGLVACLLALAAAVVALEALAAMFICQGYHLLLRPTAEAQAVITQTDAPPPGNGGDQAFAYRFEIDGREYTGQGSRRLRDVRDRAAEIGDVITVSYMVFDPSRNEVKTVDGFWILLAGLWMALSPFMATAVVVLTRRAYRPARRTTVVEHQGGTLRLTWKTDAEAERAMRHNGNVAQLVPMALLLGMGVMLTLMGLATPSVVLLVHAAMVLVVAIGLPLFLPIARRAHARQVAKAGHDPAREFLRVDTISRTVTLCSPSEKNGFARFAATSPLGSGDHFVMLEFTEVAAAWPRKELRTRRRPGFVHARGTRCLGILPQNIAGLEGLDEAFQQMNESLGSGHEPLVVRARVWPDTLFSGGPSNIGWAGYLMLAAFHAFLLAAAFVLWNPADTLALMAEGPRSAGAVCHIVARWAAVAAPAMVLLGVLLSMVQFGHLRTRWPEATSALPFRLVSMMRKGRRSSPGRPAEEKESSANQLGP